MCGPDFFVPDRIFFQKLAFFHPNIDVNFYPKVIAV